MKVKELELLTGGLSTPSKMPCRGYSIPAQNCMIGTLLRKQKGSTCSKCYALKKRYMFPNVQNAMKRRLLAIRRTDWVDNMVALIAKQEKSGYFRFHDSGDLQGDWHLDKIVEIAARLPHIQFWLPTRERAIVRNYRKPIPGNLTIRISAPIIGKALDPTPGALYSTVASGVGFQCGAYSRGGKCGPCRECWNPKTQSVDYPLH